MKGLILRGKRVKLRPIRLADASDFVRWFGDKKVAVYLLRQTPMSLQKEKAWIHGVLSGDGSLIKARPRSIPRPSHRELSADKVGWNYKVILWN
ncbi:MAG: hypothetical protein AAB666_00375, partial [Patescibacteria group bacterium]